MSRRLGLGLWCGHVDIELQVDRKSSREQVLALVPRPKWAKRVRVTNLFGGQWHVRFYR